jgi:plasmid stability protein
MGNLTIAIDEDSLKKARMRALQEGTSVNAILRDFLESYAGSKRERQDAVNDVLAISRASKTRRGGRRWSRDELHERI